MKMLKPIFVLLMACLLITSCSEDDEDTDSKNFIAFDETSYDLSKGILINEGEYTEDIYLYDIELFTSDFEFTYDEDGDLDGIYGEGQALFLALFSEDADYPAIGEYTYSLSGEAGTFYYGEAYSYVNTDEYEYEYSAISSGTITVTASGNSYKISFDLTDEDGVNITGYYSGGLTYLDYSDYEYTSIETKPLKTGVTFFKK
jgi:predicted heme/steroid binding protein